MRKYIRKHRPVSTRRIVVRNNSFRKTRITAQGGKQCILGMKNQQLNSTKQYTQVIMPNKATDCNPVGPDPNTNETIPSIIHSEVRTTITELKNGKSPGEDNIYNELLKGAQDLLIPIVTEEFNKIIQTKPGQWKTSRTALLHRKIRKVT
ncbi:uncharacterized protein LOC126281714 [Schistocerca gregaria]|uniref:uncharacterized protein LOC126281714 n=1 Tax=Schistocerca gregaria TaxID=7010 RepID=UPI00211EDDF6|nr:uncharacterized protein LOC126281714 [Schistocerca gregaria]